jgi:putative ABC transport system permease protein
LVTVIATAPGGIPGISAGREWILLPLQPLRDAVALNLLPQDVLFAAEPGATLGTDRLAEALLATPANLRTPASVSTRLTDSALIDGVRTAFPVGAGVGAGYSALAMVLTLVVTARPRHRILSHLRTLGLTAGQSRGLVALELAPLALTALAAGLAVGLATLWLVEPAVDLQPFTGGRGTPDIVIDPASVGLVAGAFLAVVALAVLSAVTASRRLRAGTVLRLGEEA